MASRDFFLLCLQVLIHGQRSMYLDCAKEDILSQAHPLPIASHWKSFVRDYVAQGSSTNLKRAFIAFILELCDYRLLNTQTVLDAWSILYVLLKYLNIVISFLFCTVLWRCSLTVRLLNASLLLLLILHRFWDISRYWSKIADCNLLPPLFGVPVGGWTRWNFAQIFAIRN